VTTTPVPPIEQAAASATSAVDEHRAIDTLRELVALPSVNPFGAAPGDEEGEELVAAYLAARAEDLGMEVERTLLSEGRSNLHATWPGEDPAAPHLVLAGHMDTVRVESYPDPFDPRVADGRVWGRGACDTKGSLAGFLEALEAMRAAGLRLRGTLTLLGVADEEYEMLGAQRAGAQGAIADAMIIGEPTSMRLCTASKGRVSTFVVTTGRAAHSSQPEGGVNAIVHMARIVDALSAHAERLRSEGEVHPLLGSPRLNPGVIEGGIQVNMVPPRCRLEIDRRTLPHETRESVYAELGQVLDGVARETPELAWQLTEPSWLIPPYELPSDHPLLDHVGDALARSGADATPQGFVGGSDAAHFRTPAIICGPGSIEQAHTDAEWVSTAELRLAAEVYVRTAISYLGVVA
jgi:acetylornithine deacetylase/succinyl-diaminopimelate desuccinylase family protein